MASDTATRIIDTKEPRVGIKAAPNRAKSRILSPLTWRILAINVFALATIVSSN